MTLLTFTIPLVCWALSARTARSGERVGAVLACCVLLEIAAAKGWLFREVRVTLITTLSVLTIVILVWGAVREHRRETPALGPAGRRGIGLALTSIYCRFDSDDQACRPDGGWALDRQRVCAWVDDLTEAPLMVVYVETDNV